MDSNYTNYTETVGSTYATNNTNKSNRITSTDNATGSNSNIGNKICPT